MPRVKYEAWKPGQEAINVIAQATVIARDYSAQGYDLTLRQLYYQFVAKALIPNSDRSYKRLGSILNKARMAGLFDWSYIIDRTRNLSGVGFFQTPDELVRNLARYHSVDHWQDQDSYIEVWVEKEALAGVVQRAAGSWGVPHFACRGYVSQSELWGAARRLLGKVTEGKRVIVLHLGDHDPSGIDMTRDIKDRLRTFTTQDYLNAHPREFDTDSVSIRDILGAMADRCENDDGDVPAQPIEVRRIALNMDQVDEYGPPPNPAKLTDSRVAGYQDLYGDQSWELDALDPATLDALIQDNIQEAVDLEKWEVHDQTQRTERARLQFVSDNWTAISDAHASGADVADHLPHGGLIVPEGYDEDED